MARCISGKGHYERLMSMRASARISQMRGHRNGAEHPRRLLQNRIGHRTAIRSKERETSPRGRSIRGGAGDIYCAGSREMYEREKRKSAVSYVGASRGSPISMALILGRLFLPPPPPPPISSQFKLADYQKCIAYGITRAAPSSLSQ